MSPTPCHCGGGEYQTCCQPFIDGETFPQTAEQLMRSRYSAYAEGKTDYLQETTHPRVRSTFDEQAVKTWSETSQWLNLTIESVRAGGAGDSAGEVVFRARYQQNGQIHDHHEHSFFEKLDERWMYLHGTQPQKTKSEKTGRNAPCPCGSGRKFKKCCAR